MTVNINGDTGISQVQSGATVPDLNVDSGTLYVDPTNNRVGIGTSSPSYSLSVNSGSNNTAAAFASTTGNGYLRISGDNLATHMTIGQDTTGTYIYSASGTPTRILQGGNTRLNIDSNGYVTTPNNVRVWMTTPNSANITGASTDVKYTVTIYNIGNAYNTSSGVFTAPVAGTYAFSWVYLLQNVADAATVDSGFLINGIFTFGGSRYTGGERGYDGYVSERFSAIRYLSANDTFTPRANVNNDGSWNVYGGGTWGYFSGCLIG